MRGKYTKAEGEKAGAFKKEMNSEQKYKIVCMEE